jgi:acyl-CoA thioester hydrolase
MDERTYKKGVLNMRVKYIENIEQWASEFSFYSEVKVRFSETDMYGHLNNTVPFIYFEQARIDYLNATGIMKDWNQSEGASIIVVADLQCDFLRQAYFNDRLRIFVKTASVGSSSIDIHYLAKNDQDEPVFVGRGALVQINPKTGKSIPLTEEDKTILLGK